MTLLCVGLGSRNPTRESFFYRLSGQSPTMTKIFKSTMKKGVSGHAFDVCKAKSVKIQHKKYIFLNFRKSGKGL